MKLLVTTRDEILRAKRGLVSHVANNIRILRANPRDKDLVVSQALSTELRLKSLRQLRRIFISQ